MKPVSESSGGFSQEKDEFNAQNEKTTSPLFPSRTTKGLKKRVKRMTWTRKGKQFYNHRGVLIGYLVVSDGWIDFIMPRKEKHKFLIYNGWGFNKSLTSYLFNQGCNRILVKTENRVLTTSPAVVLKHGIPFVYKQGSYEEEQLILMEEKMKVIKLEKEGDS